MTDKPTGLALLREPFPPHQISKLPKPYKSDSPKGKCAECGGYHGLPAVHLDYVGHAALTDRLLDCDPTWTWEPVALGQNGLPAFDAIGGLWIRLTVCGQTRLGYGHPDGKSGGNAIKEAIGDALRNAAMRFGAALDLWHKGDLHGDEEPPKDEPRKPAAKRDAPPPVTDQAIASAIDYLCEADSMENLQERWKNLPTAVKEVARVIAEKDAKKAALSATKNADLGGDNLPY